VVFGEIINGAEVLEEIGKCGSHSGEPKAVVLIDNCGVCEKSGRSEKI
jgi:hypothetical protein